jgi:hypothetical protein
MEVFTTVRPHCVTVTDAVLIPTCTLACVALKIMHRVPVIQTVKQIAQLFREMYAET